MAAPRRSQVRAASENLPVHEDGHEIEAEMVQAAPGESSGGMSSDGSLGIGSLRRRRKRNRRPNDEEHLFRDRAPSPKRLGEIEKEAKRTCARAAARRVVDFRGPLGWGDSDVELGRDPSPHNRRQGRQARLRRIQPWSSCASLRGDRAELDAIDRGAPRSDLDAVTAARARSPSRGSLDLPRYQAAHITASAGRRGVSVPAARATPTIPAPSRRPDQAARRGRRRLFAVC